MEDSRRDLKDHNLNSLLPDVQVDRRGFVAACIAAGFAVTAEPILAQAINTPMDGLDGGDAKVGDIPIYYAVPKGKGKRPVSSWCPRSGACTSTSRTSRVAWPRRAISR